MAAIIYATNVSLDGYIAGWFSFELDTAVVLQMEGAGDFAGADLAGLFVDEGKDFILAGEGNLFGEISNQ